MSAPIFDRPPATSPSASATRRRRLPLLIVASLMVAGAGLGTGVALATRHPAGPPAVAVAAAGTGSVARTQPSSRPAMPVGQSKPKADARASRASRATGSAHRGPAPVDTAGNAAVLPDGVHHAYIRRVDIARDRITVDMVQLFLDGDAVKAAVADGKSRENAQYLTVWLRNQNPRLRTLPLAADLRVRFHQTCEEPSDRRAVLTRLAASARLGVYFYSLTVHDGAVHAIKERQIIPAC
jgi:hypothetical protein